MRATTLALLALCLAGCRGPLGGCFVPADQTAGWKRVSLRAPFTALAAPDEVEQFRTGEAAIVWDADDLALGSAAFAESWLGHGNVGYRVYPPADSGALELDLSAPLDGQAVDVVVHDVHSRSFTLLHGKRILGDHVRVTWDVPGVDSVDVVLHHHLHLRPLVRRVRTGRVRVASDAAPAAFRAPGSLYFRHPGGRAITLCQAPGRLLALGSDAVDGNPAEVALRPTASAVGYRWWAALKDRLH